MLVALTISVLALALVCAGLLFTCFVLAYALVNQRPVDSGPEGDEDEALPAAAIPWRYHGETPAPPPEC